MIITPLWRGLPPIGPRQSTRRSPRTGPPPIPFPNERYEVLNEYELHDIFVGFWCKGLSVTEVAARLRADPDSATECGYLEIGDGLDLNPGDGVVWIGEQAPGWTQIIQWQDLPTLNEPLIALSKGSELLYLSWPLLELKARKTWTIWWTGATS